MLCYLMGISSGKTPEEIPQRITTDEEIRHPLSRLYLMRRQGENRRRMESDGQTAVPV
jgi:hypothetical protein